MVIVPDTGKPVFQQYHSFEELRKGVMNAMLLHPDAAIIPFCGARVHMAQDSQNQSHYYLVHPNGGTYPLYEMAPELQILADGYLVERDDEEYVEVEEEETVIEYMEDEPDESEAGPDPDDEEGDPAPVEPADDPDDEFPGV